MSRNFSAIRYIDKWSVLLYLVLVLFGWLNIYGASVGENQSSIFDMSYRSGMQFVWICISIAVAVVIFLSSSRYYGIFAYQLYWLAILALVVTVFVAPDIKGSRSWLPLGPFSIQPAEFAKFITALGLAKLMSQPHFRLQGARNYMKAAGMVLLPLLIIIMQKETGSALVYLSFVIMLYREGLPGIVPALGVCAVVLFVTVIKLSGADVAGVEGAQLGLFLGLAITFALFLIFTWRYTRDRRCVLYMLGGAAAVAAVTVVLYLFGVRLNPVYVAVGAVVAAAVYMAVLAVMRWRRSYVLALCFLVGFSGYCFSAGYIFDKVLQPHQQMRIMVLLGMADDPTGISYNTNQARIAIGSGGLTGKGFMQGTQTKLKYVPEQDTDFIFCTVGEEWGFAGSAGVLIVYLIFLNRLITLAERQQDRFVRVYGYCVVGIFTFHLMINVGMVLGLAPVIGIPLPFFSYGGSSLLSFTILLSIFLRLDTTRIERTR